MVIVYPEDINIVNCQIDIMKTNIKVQYRIKLSSILGDGIKYDCYGRQKHIHAGDAKQNIYTGRLQIQTISSVLLQTSLWTSKSAIFYKSNFY